MTYEEYCKLRDSYGLTDYAVSSLSEVSRATLSQWKNGRSKPSKSTINKIKRLFEGYKTTLEKPAGSSEMFKFDYIFSPAKIGGSDIRVELSPEINAISIKLYDGTSCDLSLDEYKQLTYAINAFIYAWIKDKKMDPNSNPNPS